MVFSDEPQDREDPLEVRDVGTQPAGPPKNSVTMIADIVIVFMNSARKNSAKRIEEYSVWKPPTSSLSASTTSKGGRLSSAVIAIQKIDEGHDAEADDVPVPDAVRPGR